MKDEVKQAIDSYLEILGDRYADAIAGRSVTFRGSISQLTKPQTGSTRYQLMAWRAGYKSAAEFNWWNRSGGD